MLLFFCAYSPVWNIGTIGPFLCYKRYLKYTMYGKKQDRLLNSSEEDSNNLAVELLNRICMSLRKRSSLEVCDKSFSIFAILKGVGASPSAPYYSRTIEEMHRLLF